MTKIQYRLKKSACEAKLKKKQNVTVLFNKEKIIENLKYSTR